MKIDRRKLSHAKLDEIRFNAVKAVARRASDNSGGARNGSIYESGIRMVSHVSGWGLGCPSSQQGYGSAEAAYWQADPMDL
jgi:hypothetical protein